MSAEARGLDGVTFQPDMSPSRQRGAGAAWQVRPGCAARHAGSATCAGAPLICCTTRLGRRTTPLVHVLHHRHTAGHPAHTAAEPGGPGRLHGLPGREAPAARAAARGSAAAQAGAGMATRARVPASVPRAARACWPLCVNVWLCHCHLIPLRRHRSKSCRPARSSLSSGPHLPTSASWQQSCECSACARMHSWLLCLARHG
jgi:hypothetical protein